MLEESKVNPTAIDSETVVLPSVKESFSSLPSSGEVRARIAAVRKVIVNYETYIAYQIVTLANRGDYPSGICVVERRYREFDWLYSRFLSIYAVLFVPPLPGKKVLSQFNRYDSSFVDRRCSGLQTFLHKSASHRILSSNPDFIAFLTLSNNDFQRYKQRYPTESSLISSLIGYSPQVLSSDAYIGTADISEQQVVDAITTTLPSNSPPQSSNPVIIPSTREVSSPQHLRQASEKFSCYQIEAMEYTALCQSLSSLLDRMTTQLATLSYDHAELAKTLEQAGQSTVVAASASTTNSEDGWASSLVGSAMRRTAQATHALASRLSDDSARPWHENAAFGEAVKRVLKNRQTIQVSILFIDWVFDFGPTIQQAVCLTFSSNVQYCNRDIYFSLDQEVKERRRLEGDGSEDVVFQHPQAPASTDTTAVLTSDTQVNSTSYKWLARFASMPWRSNSKRRKNIPISEVSP
ncbi:unnamed protein product [Rodentolepis nana]|uniref:PX domain-containing protein n=1 Tax=Rodentolepis nana TaxID=102285 RepID=A0A0R3TY57_RODNA|nr:unnamed protein product [Rodentolepis nana]